MKAPEYFFWLFKAKNGPFKTKFNKYMTLNPQHQVRIFPKQKGFSGAFTRKNKKTTCLQGVLVPLVSVLGLCGNLLSILVLTSSKIDMKVMRKQK